MEVLVEGRPIIMLDMAHMLMFGVMAFVARRTWSPAQRTQRPRRAWSGQSLRTNLDDMGPSLLLTAALSRHRYADGRGADLCVVALRLVQVVVIKVIGLMMVIDRCLVVIGVIGRVVVVAVQDIFTRLAHS
jgi:hypothetical protein